MNDRIRELAEQAENYAREQNDKFGLSYKREYDKKFAELIVRECISLCEDLKMQHKGYRMEETDFSMKNIYAEGEATCDLLQYKMKEHFRVNDERANSRTCQAGR